MAELTEYLQRLRHSQPFIDMDMSNIQMFKQIQELNPNTLQTTFSVTDFSIDSLLAHHHRQHHQQQQSSDQFPINFGHYNSFSSTVHHPEILNSAPVFQSVTCASCQNVFPYNSKKRKAKAQSPCSSKNISPTASASISPEKKNCFQHLGRGKKGKNKEKEVDKAEQIIHVGAKRGQATDSHSIAERVRREKINNKLRCLQDLVPGCHKSMGMAVMLEEIINYVHSLQNQVEFLSMELAAASCSYDLNLKTESSKNAQGTNSSEAQETEKWLKERYRELGCFESTWSI